MDCPVKSFYGVFESRELQRHSSVREKVTFGGNPISWSFIFAEQAMSTSSYLSVFLS